MVILCCAFVLISVISIPFASVRLPEIPAIIPLSSSGILVAEFATSFLLFAWFHEVRSWSLLVLACTYLFASSMAVLQVLTFPDAVMVGRIIVGMRLSTGWAYMVWISGYALLTFAALLLEAFSRRRVSARAFNHAVIGSISATVAIIAGLAWIILCVPDRLPILMRGSEWTGFDQFVAYGALSTLAAGVAIGLLVIRARNPLFLWLTLAMTAMACANLINEVGGGRYTLGWTVGRLSWAVSASVLFLFFLGQFVRQQKLLTQARDTLEQRVVQRTAELTATVSQRDVLLREVYHRVNGNLQVLDALIALQSGSITDTDARAAVAALHHHILALGLVQQHLMASDDKRTFLATDFLRELTDSIVGARGSAVADVSVCADAVMFDTDFAVPFGLLTTELLTGMLSRQDANNINVELRRAGVQCAVLTVAADSAGQLLEGSPRARIVSALLRQLGGKMTVAERNGTRIEVRLSVPESA